nr:putative ribonuclease H-like domain-containing protein [Tanacetum cinerariifolium]
MSNDCSVHMIWGVWSKGFSSVTVYGIELVFGGKFELVIADNRNLKIATAVDANKAGHIFNMEDAGSGGSSTHLTAVWKKSWKITLKVIMELIWIVHPFTLKGLEPHIQVTFAALRKNNNGNNFAKRLRGNRQRLVRKTVEASEEKLEKIIEMCTTLQKENEDIKRKMGYLLEQLAHFTRAHLPQEFDKNVRTGGARHMTGNMSYLSEYEDIDGGYVAFGRDPKGGKITGKGKICTGKKPALSFMRPFGCPVTILNTLDHLGRGPTWLFNIDTLTDSINYKSVVAGNQTNGNAGTKENINAGQAGKKTLPDQEYILLPLWTKDSLFSSTSKQSPDDGFKPSGDKEKQDAESPGNDVPRQESQEQDTTVNSTNNLTTISPTVNTAGIQDSVVDENIVYGCANDHNMPELEDTSIFKDSHKDVFGAEADFNNMESTYQVSHISTTRVHKDHLVEQIIGDLYSAPRTRRMTKSVTNHGMISSIPQRINHQHLNTCLFACFFSQIEPTRVAKALTNHAWVEAMQEELLQFKLQKVWILVDLPNGKRAIGTKWVFRNKKYKRGIVIKNKARLVAQGYSQEEGIDYNEVFTPVARIKAIRLFLAYASYMGFMVYQMDVNNTFLYGRIKKEVYVCQPPGFEDPDHPDMVYKVVKALYGLRQAPKSLDKYVIEVLRKFNLIDVKPANTPVDTEKHLVKDANGDDVDVHLYRSMIRSLMYLTTSRLDIMYAVCICARFQVTPKVSHLHAVKRIFRYLKSKPKLGLWYLRDSPFELVAYTDSDYAGASLDRKSTTGGCQFLGRRSISWQCKKQTMIATSTTKAEYMAAASCCRQLKVNAVKPKLTTAIDGFCCSG